MRYGLVLAVLFWTGAAVTAGGEAAATKMPFIINEDDSHFYFSRANEDMTLEGLQAWVDQYADTKVTHLFLCPNAMRASFGSEVWDRIWEPKTQAMPPEGSTLRHWMDNGRLLHERGLDAYAVWIARSREKGLSPWLSMRMNDVHNVDDPTHILHSVFWAEHPEFRRVPDNPRGWVDYAFDYLHPEVREHHMKFIRELLERYDPDGLELDWMRFGYHFKPGHEAEGREVLTEFVREVRDLTRSWAAKRGHAILLGARVPTHPDAAYGLGMDGVTWVREGLVDMLVPAPFWATADFDIPIELWRERLGDAGGKVVLAAGLEVLLRAHPGGKQTTNDLASVRGFAAAHLSRGADALYLFNYMDPAPIHGGKEAYRALLEEGLGLDVAARNARRYPVTYRDTVPAGVDAQVRLPAKTLDAPALFTVYTGPKTPGAPQVVLGVPAATAAEAAFDVELNGVACAAVKRPVSAEVVPGENRLLVYEAPDTALAEGFNRIQVRQQAGQPEAAVEWVELRLPGIAE